MKGFFIGFGFGLAVGLLFAPLRGEDIRVMAAVKASEIADTARGTYDQVEKAVSSIRVTGDEATQRTGTEG